MPHTIVRESCQNLVVKKSFFFWIICHFPKMAHPWRTTISWCN